MTSTLAGCAQSQRPTTINRTLAPAAPDEERSSWAETVDRYKRPDRLKGWWQVINSFLPFFGVWYLMFVCYTAGAYWALLPLVILAAGFRVRIFIIQHDCGHRAFFHSRWANDLLGFLCGVVTLTPYYFWRRAHALHHASSGNLDGRGQGDVGMLTVAEYLRRSRWGRLRYRLYRNPLIMFLPGASFLFIIRHRFTIGLPRAWRRERMSVHATNLAILAVLALAWWTIGLGTFLLIDVPSIMVGASIGTWMFYIQHQYEDAYWQSQGSWDFTRSALEGSSYYRLPPLLQWFTGNIGFHHIHHLNSRIPNYHLPACYAAEPAFRQGTTFGLRESLKCISLKLWDEQSQRMVGFKEAHAMLPASSPAGG
jgi:omega-6 fatty acid desaturase (delta-12 desaturase)